MQINKYMNMAYAKAIECYNKKIDIPIGCIILDNNHNIIAMEHNKCMELNNPTFHAEMLAINKACLKLKTSKLNNCILYTTLEPCLMCTGAIMNSRIKTIYFGAFDKQYGCVESNNILHKNNFAYKPNIYGGIMEKECTELISLFFKALRSK